MKLRDFGAAAIALGAFVLWWFLLSRGYSAELWPSPVDVARAMHTLFAERVLSSHVVASVGRMLSGYFIAVAIAIPSGLVLGTWARGLEALDPLFQVARPISPIAWFPLAVLWFGVGDRPAIFIIALATFFPVFMASVNAVRAVPMNYLHVAKNFGASRVFLFASVVVPSALPQILVGLRIGLGISWVNLVAGEMLGSQSGLGYLIVDARNSLRTDRILAVMIFIGVLGWLLDRLMSSLAKVAPGVRA